MGCKMRVNSVMPSIQARSQIQNNGMMSMPVSTQSSQRLNSLSMGNVNNILIHDRSSVAKQGFACITFTGSDRNVNQVLSAAYENKGTGLREDSQGGMGVVTYEAPKSLIERENMDVRSVMPFHEFNNPKGGVKYINVKKVKEAYGGKLPEAIAAKWFVEAAPFQSVEDLAKALNQEVADLRPVIQSEPNSKGAEGLSKFVLLRATGAKGEFVRMSDDDIGKLQKVGYQLFQIAEDTPGAKDLRGRHNYYMYTQELAKTPKPYTYGIGGADGMDAEINNSDFCRALLKAEGQMNSEEFGYFHPASIWGHDRPVAMLTSLITDESARGNEAYNGVITHHTLHNPGRNYQGVTDNPFKFARMVFSPEDVEATSKHPQYELLQNFNVRGWENLREPEKKFVTQAFEPFIGVFRDAFGTYNVTKIPILAKKLNPNNFSVGTVSPNFNKEMKSPEMDVAAAIGGDLREIETVSPLNGSTPASLGIDNNVNDFGRGNNTLSAQKSGFTPLIYNGNNIDEIVANREKNAKWLTRILANAEKEGQDALNHVFFNDLQIEQGRSVLGSLSEFKDGDMLFIGWGRPDEQKGYPYTFEGFLNFLKREDVPKETKLRTKLIVGAGDAPWYKEAKDFKLIQKALQEIQELDGGAYKHNAMYVDGLFPNRLVACATHGIFTSRREMCGITPLEAKTAGVPYIATRTGGMVDYTNESNGWRTKTAPEMNPDFDGLTWEASPDEIDNARIKRISAEVSDCFKEATTEYVDHHEAYVAKAKKNIEEKLDWHNNAEFNGGKSANEMYKNDIWHIDQGWEARDKSPMRRLVGANLEEVVEQAKGKTKAVEEAATQAVETAVKDNSQIARNKWTRTLIGSGVAIAALGTATYAYLKRTKKTTPNETKEAVQEQPKTDEKKTVDKIA